MAKKAFPKITKNAGRKTKTDPAGKSLSVLKTRLKGSRLRTLGPANLTNALIASIGEGLIIVDEYGYIDQINQVALDTLGFDRSELVGKWYPSALHIYDELGKPIFSYDRPIIKALLTGKSVLATVNYKNRDGNIVPVTLTASPFLVSDKPKGAVVIFRDITQELQIERAKDEFVSIASHQLRSPLTSIGLFAELLRDSTRGKLSKKELGYIDKILFSTEKMASLATDLLNISRIELGQLVIRSRPTDLDQLISSRVEEIKPVAEVSNVKVIYKNLLESAHEVAIDRDLLGQVIHNLLSNAVRYSGSAKRRKGRVEVSLSKTNRHYKIIIADNGIGIPKSTHSQIFERFYRADNAVRTDPEGNGLGLYLVKAIIENSGGKVSYKSQEDRGTTFNVFIPLSGMKLLK